MSEQTFRGKPSAAGAIARMIAERDQTIADLQAELNESKQHNLGLFQQLLRLRKGKAAAARKRRAT